MKYWYLISAVNVQALSSIFLDFTAIGICSIWRFLQRDKMCIQTLQQKLWSLGVCVQCHNTRQNQWTLHHSLTCSVIYLPLSQILTSVNDTLEFLPTLRWHVVCHIWYWVKSSTSSLLGREISFSLHEMAGNIYTGEKQVCCFESEGKQRLKFFFSCWI